MIICTWDHVMECVEIFRGLKVLNRSYFKSFTVNNKPSYKMNSCQCVSGIMERFRAKDGVSENAT